MSFSFSIGKSQVSYGDLRGKKYIITSSGTSTKLNEVPTTPEKTHRSLEVVYQQKSKELRKAHSGDRGLGEEAAIGGPARALLFK